MFDRFIIHVQESTLVSQGRPLVAAALVFALSNSSFQSFIIPPVPGQEPFGKKQFAAANQQMKDLKVQGNVEILEIEVLGDWAWMRNRLRVTMTPSQGKSISHRGYVLTILRKNQSGAWVIYRDANLLTPEPV